MALPGTIVPPLHMLLSFGYLCKGDYLYQKLLTIDHIDFSPE